MKILYILLSFTFLTAACKRTESIVSTEIETANGNNTNPSLVLRADQYTLSGQRATIVASNSIPINFEYDGKNVQVTPLSRNIADLKNSPIFEYGNLLNRAIAYKNEHPQTDVKVKFVMYKIGTKTYIGFNPLHGSYGYVKGNDFGDEHTEKLIYSIVKSALNQVHIDFVYQFDVSGNVYDYINGFMETPCTTDPSKKVKDYLRIRKVNWGKEAYQQMHAKYMTVSHHTGDVGNIFNTVMSTTGNVDDHDLNGLPVGKDWVQSGMKISGHEQLMLSYNRYFDLIYNNYDNQAQFQTQVRLLHETKSLNYDDKHFGSFFTPIPLLPTGKYVVGQADSSASHGDAWDMEFNPVAKFISKMATVPGDRYLKANVYHIKMDNFGEKLYSELQSIYQSPLSGLKHFRFLAKTNSYESSRPLEVFNNIGIIHQPKNTHSKDMLFAFSGISTYYTMTGSTNLKLDEYTSKANSSIVVKEYTTAHPVYNAFKEIFNYQF